MIKDLSSPADAGDSGAAEVGLGGDALHAQGAQRGVIQASALTASPGSMRRTGVS